MCEVSEATRVQFDIKLPSDGVLLGVADKINFGDRWFNFITLEWDHVDAEFVGLACDNYLVSRHKTAIQDNELPVWPKGA